MKTFGIEYRHDGATWNAHILAEDHTDAERRLRAIRGNAEIIGELVGTVPALPGIGWLVRLRCWLGNLRRVS